MNKPSSSFNAVAKTLKSNPAQAARMAFSAAALPFTIFLPSPLSFVVCGILTIDVLMRQAILIRRLIDSGSSLKKSVIRNGVAKGP